MKKYLFLALLCFTVQFLKAQVPPGLQTSEMKEMVSELRKEIQLLEDEIKKTEREDPESAASMKARLNTYKTMLAGFGKGSLTTAKTTTSAPASAKTTPRIFSPLTPVHLKQPVVQPLAGQAKDRFFWYKGKKINDSTLVTMRKTVVQYSRKRQMLIVQPDEKKDSFLVISKEIGRNEMRKNELVNQLDKTKNGFIYYPYIVNTLSNYDDITARFSEIVDNTFTFNEPLPGNSNYRPGNNQPSSVKRGPNGDANDFMEEWGRTDSIPGIRELVLQQLQDAQQKLEQLPGINNFQAPSPHELGRCGTCDTAIITRQRRLDEKWIEAYQGKEKAIVQQAISALRTYELSGNEKDDVVFEKFDQVFQQLNKRIEQKDALLLNRYGDNLQYLPVIIPVILGHQRQRQLLGEEGQSSIGELVGKMNSAYDRYYEEQREARNHDFMLNVPFHLGIYRQRALLGVEESMSSLSDYFQQLLAYNRFALTMEMDFIWQQDADGKLERRATGTMETAGKIYVWLFPDSCSYRIMAHGTDLNNKTFENITLPMKVKGGMKTIREQDDQLKDYPYQGPPEYAFRFPDSKIDFCDNGSDTLFLALIGGNEEVAARAMQDMQDIAKAYTIDMLVYAGQVLINEDARELIEGSQEAGLQILNTISGFMGQGAPGSTLQKLQTQYEGYMAMDDQRKLLENAYSSTTARIVFNANNRSTVLTDTYLDTKRKMDNDVEVKKGMFHLRMVHEPRP